MSIPDTESTRPAESTQHTRSGDATDDLMTAVEAAAALRVSRSHVYGLARRGTLTAVRIGRTVRIHRASVDALLHTDHHA